MKILITGGSGLLAGRLTNYLSHSNEITILSRKKISHLFDKKNIYTYTFASLNDLSDDFIKHDIVIHASGPNHDKCNDKNLVKKYIEETKHLVNLSSRNKYVKKFIFLSSIRSVSENTSGIITEDSLSNPVTNYGLLKENIEKYLCNYKSKNSMVKIILRLTNGYGYPAHSMSDCWDLVIMNVCQQAIIDGKIVLKSNGLDCKDFMPIQSMIEVIENILSDSSLNHTHIFNISSGTSIKVIDFIEKIKTILELKLSKNIPIEIKGKEGSAPSNSLVIDNSKIQKSGYLSDINHNQEIEDLINYCIKIFQ